MALGHFTGMHNKFPTAMEQGALPSGGVAEPPDSEIVRDFSTFSLH